MIKVESDRLYLFATEMVNRHGSQLSASIATNINRSQINRWTKGIGTHLHQATIDKMATATERSPEEMLIWLQTPVKSDELPVTDSDRIDYLEAEIKQLKDRLNEVSVKYRVNDRKH